MGYLVIGTGSSRVILGDEHDVERAKRDMGEPYRDPLTGKPVTAEDIKAKEIIGA